MNICQEFRFLAVTVYAFWCFKEPLEYQYLPINSGTIVFNRSDVAGAVLQLVVQLVVQAPLFHYLIKLSESLLSSKP